MKQTDHDLLVTVSTRLIDLGKQVEELKNGTFLKIASLEKDKADKDVVENIRQKLEADIEIRVRKLEDDSNLNKGDSKGISNTWKAVVIILTLIIGALTYYSTIVK